MIESPEEKAEAKSAERWGRPGKKVRKVDERMDISFRLGYNDHDISHTLWNSPGRKCDWAEIGLKYAG